MAGGTDFSDYDAPSAYGGQMKMKAALDKFLAERDPKEARQRLARSSYGKGQVAVLRQAPTILLIKEALRREQAERAREQGRIRQQRHREKLRREAALLAQSSESAPLQSS